MSRKLRENDRKGLLEIERKNGDLVAKNVPIQGETVCIINSGEIAESGDVSTTVPVNVGKFRQGIGDNTNYLTVDLLDDDGQHLSDISSLFTPSNEDDDVRESRGMPERETRKLTQIRGTGDYINVKAKIFYIEYVEKDRLDMPDIKGVLVEDKSTKQVPFVVNKDVLHPYFEQGEYYFFKNVKDHRYEKGNENQILISEKSTVEKL
ncbi:hypothetical protein [Halanaeroarchaeum sp. HSR-CO]|uniref:hypothetical protein n=1 Tax=Halanaeroarchaeum sp. HSR-CO TaxID=2866382 RepID=UPI00217EE77A|nr:hypothetical protein [Halanaeroarchaeum sp. HSR-CO]